MLIFRHLCYRLYRTWYALGYWARQRFTKSGGFVVFGIGSAAVLGLDTNLAMAYQAFMLLSVLLAVALVTTRSDHTPYKVQRHVPRLGAVDVVLAYDIVVTNLSKQPRAGLSLIETLPDPRPSFDMFCSSPEPDEQRRNRFDRTFIFHRWLWLIARRRIADAAVRNAPDLPPGGTARIRMQLHPKRRGLLELPAVIVARTDLFGLCRACSPHAVVNTVLILPRRYRIPDFHLPGTPRYQPGGVACSAVVGESEEFMALRDYRAGDPMRHIHWRSWAKIGRPVVKEFEDEFLVRHALIVDTFIDNDDGRFEEAVSVAASFACTLDTQESLLDLMFVANRAYRLTAGRGQGTVDHMLEALASVQPCRDGSLDTLEALAMSYRSLLSGCICVLLDWEPERQRLVRTLRTAGVPTIVFVIVPRGSSELEHNGEFYPLAVGNIESGLAQSTISS